MKRLTNKTVVIDTEAVGHTPAVTKASLPFNCAIEAAAQAVHTQANGGGNRCFQAVSSKDGFTCVVRHGRTLIEIQGDNFAVRQLD